MHARPGIRKEPINAQEDADVQAAANQAIGPDPQTGGIVGDLSKIETPIRAFGLGPVQGMDADGNRIREQGQVAAGTTMQAGGRVNAGPGAGTQTACRRRVSCAGRCCIRAWAPSTNRTLTVACAGIIRAFP